MKKVVYKDIEVNYDVKSLLKSLDYYEWEEPYGAEYTDESWMTKTLKEFDKLKAKFHDKIENLDKDMEKLLSKLDITKKGLLAKGRRNILLDSGICVSYNDHHGSHAYDNIYLYASIINDKKCELKIGTFTVQSSF